MANGPDQIRQMVNFILQEAHEKANEIRIKTEHDFNVDKQTIVHNAKVAIADEYKAKEREREVQARIARSTAVGDARVKKMKVRDELLHELVQQLVAHLHLLDPGVADGRRARDARLHLALALLGLVLVGDRDLGVVHDGLLVHVEVVLRLDADLVRLLVGLLEDEVDHLPDLVRAVRHGARLRARRAEEARAGPPLAAAGVERLVVDDLEIDLVAGHRLREACLVHKLENDG
mmetsp:Transcript_10914/g.32574  ORF Transcript_10914/g.32574 Transcript_10914/m.32574 type:complete len:233 (-) Transcript_10914:148-846(-)